MCFSVYVSLCVFMRVCLCVCAGCCALIAFACFADLYNKGSTTGVCCSVVVLLLVLCSALLFLLVVVEYRLSASCIVVLQCCPRLWLQLVGCECLPCECRYQIRLQLRPAGRCLDSGPFVLCPFVVLFLRCCCFTLLSRSSSCGLLCCCFFSLFSTCSCFVSQCCCVNVQSWIAAAVAHYDRIK